VVDHFRAGLAFICVLPVKGCGNRGSSDRRGRLGRNDARLGEPGVRLTLTSTSASSGKDELATIALLGQTGSQTELLAGPASATITAVGGKVYVQETGSGLTSLLKMPVALAARSRGRPIAISPSDPPYDALSSGDSLASLPEQILPTTDQVEVMSGVLTGDGRRVIALRWESQPLRSAPVIEHTLIVRDSAEPLPIELINSSRGVRDVIRFSGWGMRVALQAPSGSVPYSALAKK
jgi:hypothetical protein